MKRMKMSLLASFGLAFLFCLASVSAIQADFIVPVPNGDFSLPSIAPDPYRFTVPTDWSYSGSGAIGVEQGGSGQCLFLASGNGTLQNDIGANVHALGDIYTLTFDGASLNPNGLGSWTANLLVDGNVVASSTIAFNGYNDFAQYSVVWTANTAGALGVEFVGVGTGSTQLALDNVGLSYNSVPEPSTMALLMTGLVGLLANAWRKRK